MEFRFEVKASNVLSVAILLILKLKVEKFGLKKSIGSLFRNQSCIALKKPVPALPGRMISRNLRKVLFACKTTIVYRYSSGHVFSPCIECCYDVFYRYICQKISRFVHVLVLHSFKGIPGLLYSGIRPGSGVAKTSILQLRL